MSRRHKEEAEKGAQMDEIRESAEGEDILSPVKLEFPPVSRSHILKCSYHSWQPRCFTVH